MSQIATRPSDRRLRAAILRRTTDLARRAARHGRRVAHDLSHIWAPRTVGEVARWWFETFCLRLKSADKMRPVVESHFIASDLGPRPAREVTGDELTRWLTARTRNDGKPLSGRTRNLFRVYLRSMFRRALKAGYVAENVALDIPRFPADDAPLRAYRKDEIKRLLRACPEWLRVMVGVSAGTGVRRSELYRLTVEDVDLTRWMITVRQSKSGKPRVVPVVEWARPWVYIAVREAKSGLLFPARKGPTKGSQRNNGSSLLRELHRAMDAAGLPRRRQHDLRHSFGRLAVEAGVHLRALQVAMGHADMKTTERYAHVDAEWLRLEFEKVR